MGTKIKLSRPIIFVAAILIMISIGVFSVMRSAGKNKAEYILKKESIRSSVYGLGAVTAVKTFEVKVGITSSVNQIFVSEGNQVTKGTRLISFDSGVVVVAPFEGVVTSISIKTGELAYPQFPILQLIDLTNRYVLVAFEQQSAALVKPGMKAKLSFEGSRHLTFEGEVKSVYPNNSQFFVKIDVKDLPDSILPGMTLDTAIEIFKKDNAYIAPVNLIKGNEITVRRSGKQFKIPIKLGIIEGNRAEIVSQGIEENDVLISY